jgi:hypothetical protein
MPFHVGRQPINIQDEALNLEIKHHLGKNRKGEQLRSHPGRKKRIGAEASTEAAYDKK